MGLRSKLLLPILLGFVGFAIVIHFYWGASLQDDKRNSILSQESALLKTLEPGINRSLLAGDLAALHNTLDYTSSTHNERWIQVVLLNNQEQRLYPFKEPKPLAANNHTQLTHPLIWDDEKIGSIQLTLDLTKELQIEKRRIFNFELFTLLLFALLGLISATWQNFVIQKPIQRLEKAATRLANGDYRTRLPDEGNDELANLTRAFNTMGSNLSRSTNSLKEMAQIARTNEVRTSTVLNNIADGIITIDKLGTIESFTPAASHIFGYSEGEIKGKNVSLLIPEKYQDEHFKGMQRYHKSGYSNIIGKRIETEGKRKNGEIFPLELSINEMKFDDHHLFSGIARDITEHHRIAILKDEFVSTVSHELRTPLTSISGSLGLINGGALGEVPEKVKEMLILAGNNTERLLLLVNDILDMQKVEAGDMDFSPKIMELFPFIEQALDANKGYAERLNVKLVITENCHDIYSHADADRLMQVMCNLISNAAKFSPPGNIVEISSIPNGSNIRISVTDHGPGIPADFQSKLFDKFTQGNSTNTRKPGGTGLGLSISKAIVERHDGEIGFTTEEGVGTSFWFTLPIATHENEIKPSNNKKGGQKTAFLSTDNIPA